MGTADGVGEGWTVVSRPTVATVARSGSDAIQVSDGPVNSIAPDRSISSRSASTSLVSPPSDSDEDVNSEAGDR